MTPLSSRASVMLDLEGDGDLDIVTNELHDAPMVLVSDLAERKPIRWLKVVLVGTASNRDGLGALVRVSAGGKAYLKPNDGKSGYLSQSALPLYFGLGEAAKVDRVEVGLAVGAQAGRDPRAAGERHAAHHRAEVVAAAGRVLRRPRLRRDPRRRDSAARVRARRLRGGRRAARRALRDRLRPVAAQAPARDHGRRGRAPRLRQRRLARHLRRERRGDAEPGKGGPAALEPPLPERRATAASRTSPRRRAWPAAATTSASPPATTTTTETPTSSWPACAGTPSSATTATAPSRT